MGKDSNIDEPLLEALILYSKLEEYNFKKLKKMNKSLSKLKKVNKKNKSTTLLGVITFFMISSVIALVIILTVIGLQI